MTTRTPTAMLRTRCEVFARSFLLIGACVALGGLPARGDEPKEKGAATAGARRPNVLFLFADDQRADTIHALGNPTIQTPNLDRLARTGCVLRNAYCSGGNVPAVCLPSRTMLMSGR